MFKWHTFDKRNERLLCQNLQPFFIHVSQPPMPQLRRRIFLSCTNNIFAHLYLCLVKFTTNLPSNKHQWSFRESPFTISKIVAIAFFNQNMSENHILVHIRHMTHILQFQGVSSVSLNTNISNSQNVSITIITHPHSPNVSCFVWSKELISWSDMVGRGWINHPFNIRMWNLVTVIFSYKENHLFNCQDNSGILFFYFILIFLIFLFILPSLAVSSYVTFFVTVETLEFSFQF